MSPDDVRRLLAAIAGAADASDGDRLEFQAGGKRFAWTWLVREEPHRPRVPRPEVLAVRCPIERKEMLIEAAPAIYFDEPHYQGFPAVLVRLEAIDAAELSGLLRQAMETLVGGRQGARSQART